ncbi:hypothetical protein CPB84DRAFT_1959162 [Gymnopilus junonius]|uniref:Uncharacterized protein n=1 Tax=Gymnopilus junonius TaxID=109634 RepID=A0A9P5NTB7_GYMJU|nr:hypothetical protein CPB84DRAFT_1959162 [Gymnopilus junonius]
MSRLSAPRSLLSTANEVAVQLERYLRFSMLHRDPDYYDISATGSTSIGHVTQEMTEALRQWIICRMEIRRSSRPNASTSCSDHQYLVLELSDQSERFIRLCVNFTSCSRQLHIQQIGSVLQGAGYGGEAFDPELYYAENLVCPPCPPSTPAPLLENITVTPFSPNSSMADECHRRISLSVSDVDSVYEPDESSEPAMDENGEFTLLSLALLMRDSLKDIVLEEMKPIPLCQTIANTITDVVGKIHQPWIENASSSASSTSISSDELFSSPADSHEQPSSEIDIECLLAKRRILELQFRLAVVKLKSACANLKIFNLKNTAFEIDPAEDKGRLGYEQLLDLLQKSN